MLKSHMYMSRFHIYVQILIYIFHVISRAHDLVTGQQFLWDPSHVSTYIQIAIYISKLKYMYPNGNIYVQNVNLQTV